MIGFRLLRSDSADELARGDVAYTSLWYVTFADEQDSVGAFDPTSNAIG